MPLWVDFGSLFGAQQTSWCDARSAPMLFFFGMLFLGCFGSPPRGPKSAPRGSKRPPKRPRRPQEGLKRPQEPVKRSQDPPKSAQRGSKRPPRAPKEAPRRPQETTRDPKTPQELGHLTFSMLASKSPNFHNLSKILT